MTLTHLPCTLIGGAISVSARTTSVSLALKDLSHTTATVALLTPALPMLNATKPLTHVHTPITVDILSFPMQFSLAKFSLVSIPICPSIVLHSQSPVLFKQGLASSSSSSSFSRTMTELLALLTTLGRVVARQVPCSWERRRIYTVSHCQATQHTTSYQWPISSLPAWVGNNTNPTLRPPPDAVVHPRPLDMCQPGLPGLEHPGAGSLAQLLQYLCMGLLCARF